MVKITFEVSEDFIRERASVDSFIAKVDAKEGGYDSISFFIESIGFQSINQLVKEGNTEFTVNPDKIDKASKEIFNIEIGKICLLAAFSFNRQEE